MCSNAKPCSYSAQGDLVCYSKEPNLTGSFALQGSSPFFQGVVYPGSSLLNRPGMQTYQKSEGAPAAPAAQAKTAQFDWATVGRKPV